jgi:FKBP-type peptidyl-prolyl cis-trans isomerase FklB
MKLRILACFIALLFAFQVGAQTKQPEKKASATQKDKVFATQKEKVSYAIGLDIARKLKMQMYDIDTESISRGIKDVMAGTKPLMTEQEVRETLMAYQEELKAKQEQKMKEQGEKNKKEGDAFLAENKKKPGVITLPSGLQYKVIKEGTGKSPKPEDTVVTHYKGTLIDGTEFDSSYSRNQPATFQVKGVIKGWTEALQLMKVGSKWQLFIPPDLAYGKQGAGRVIGPDAVLIFEVELLEVK